MVFVLAMLGVGHHLGGACHGVGDHYSVLARSRVAVRPLGFPHYA